MGDKNWAIGGALCLSVALLIGCGGGSASGDSTTSGNRPPVASAPSCRLADLRIAQRAPQVGAEISNILIPESSVELLSDAGVRAHTNHLIFLGNRSSRPAGPSGYTPAQIAKAYGEAPAGAGAIAVVDAYNYSAALSDFNVFASQFGLPQETSSDATSSSNAVFQVVYAAGQEPSDDASWAEESAVDMEWSHALAPQAKIYLVEAASSSMPDIMAAVGVAKSLPGVREVSISFGVSETSCLYATYDSVLVEPGVAFFASAGDSPAVRDFPSLSSNVISVGGTSLTVSNTGTWVSESVWSDTGCGPSAYEPRPLYQDPYYSIVGLYRAACDIVAVGDPDTGVAAYDSVPYQGLSGWLEVGGTSVSCPVVAGIANSSGATFGSSLTLNTTLYGAAGSQYFHAITRGSSGGYSAGTPWSFPTGLGSPKGLAGLLGG